MWVMPCYGPINPDVYFHHMRAMAAVAKFGFKVNPAWVAISDKMALDTASNWLVSMALAQNADYVFWTEMDMMMPEDAIPRLMDRGKDVCGGLYFLRGDEGQPQPCVYRKYQSAGARRFGQTPVALVDFDRLYRVDAMGMGCVLIKTDVFRKIGGGLGPWFLTLHDEKTGRVICGQDMYFYARCWEEGVECYLDTSVRCDQENGMTTIGPKDYVASLRRPGARVSNGIIAAMGDAEDPWETKGRGR